ncbi:uncharacterized protein EKO05_0004701 [Ascochyta rabiei]|uniref:Catalytic n=1 Tax=Didymella rabiei TaxID=5454 RepID=A0A163KQ21_DIDRA|nr:uncharacterized protein EKO05_0004701 [Ascochyta rabiei]KZM27161.1 catalytic [Ascochyta rabiei]UPX14212.1 hypothetical protein EKO05_0004701 [Ascochyta rabiei]
MHLSHFTILIALAIGASGISKPYTALDPAHLPDRLIALEEHVISPSLEAEATASGDFQLGPPGIFEKLKDVGAGRIAAMDAGNLSIQVLSQLPGSGSEDPEGCRKANDAVRSAIEAYPTRFAGFAVLPMGHPEEAVAELERAVTRLGFRGAMIWNHLKNGTYYDGAPFDALFAMAEKLDVPIYLHPTAPTLEMLQTLFVGNYDAQTTDALSSYAWGWHVDVGTHVLRLYSAGLFDRFPKLKLILGHNGENLSGFIDRIDGTDLRSNSTFDRVWNTNIWITTSGFFSVRNFQQLRLVTPIERIMYSVEYPYHSMIDGWEFVQKLVESKVLLGGEIDLFAYKNAETLLKL